MVIECQNRGQTYSRVLYRYAHTNFEPFHGSDFNPLREHSSDLSPICSIESYNNNEVRLDIVAGIYVVYSIIINIYYYV
jgi:hypothetical protein